MFQCGRVARIIISLLVVSVLLVFTLMPGVVNHSVKALPPGPWVITFTVTAAAPLSDLPPGAYILGDGLCPSPGPFAALGCTLREAVDEANFLAAGLIPPAYIMVGFAGSMPIEIYYGNIVVLSNVIINGNPPGTTLITISPMWIAPPPPLPPAVPPPYDIFLMAGSDSEIYGLTVGSIAPGVAPTDDAISITGNKNLVDANVMFSNGGAGVHISGPSPAGGMANTVNGNWIGIDYTDTCLGNNLGVRVDTGASTNSINHNIISCNTADGILLDSAAGQVALTTIDSNTIGLDSTDLVAKPNGQNGIDDIQAAGTVINNNLISANGADGVRLTGSVGTTITNSYIGTDGTASVDLGNTINGVLIEDAGDDGGAANNITVGPGNVISGNESDGVEVNGAYMDAVTIKGNIIGLDGVGTSSLYNFGNGVHIHDTSHITVGGLIPATDRNLISGNGNNGIFITQSNDNLIYSNYIGLDVNGADLGNYGGGIRITGNASYDNIISPLAPVDPMPEQFISCNGDIGIYVASADRTVIGPTTYIGVEGDKLTACGNGEAGIFMAYSTLDSRIHPQVVAYNGGPGIVIDEAASTGNTVLPALAGATLQMDIFNNGKLPIDLFDDGHTPNDPGDTDTGPNTLLNYPELTSFNATTLSGTVCNNCEVYLYEAIGNPAADGGGGLFLAKTTATGTTWTASLPGGYRALDLTFVAFDPATGNTSEMSPLLHSYLPMILR
ncbi:MAG: right-handed parallel beta-helix repeat-containing protein [Anaerolineaceae bacterium]|nr:right-handed parallel beta-helix repeat-containing protein [Anaerolineaceae bacterium]MBN2677755.1 right-handed parallel beta-helix repeat-containing protein [Anaerolineaceae bacterium]